MPVTNREVESARKAALTRAADLPLIRVKAEPPAVKIGDSVHVIAEFFSRSAKDPCSLSVASPPKPVVELISEPAIGEPVVALLQPEGSGKYGCHLRPTKVGTYQYKVKYRGADSVGQLLEIDVFDDTSGGKLQNLFHR